MEPEQLKRGKEFQEKVQKDFKRNSDGSPEKEAFISFEKMKEIRQKSGRMDIVITYDDDDFIMIMEIKATEWDRIKPRNIRKNLWRHGRQLHRYIDKYMEVDNLGSVGLAMIYPSAPKKEGLREKIEDMALELYSFPVYWFDEIRTAKPTTTV